MRTSFERGLTFAVVGIATMSFVAFALTDLPVYDALLRLAVMCAALIVMVFAFALAANEGFFLVGTMINIGVTYIAQLLVAVYSPGSLAPQFSGNAMVLASALAVLAIGEYCSWQGSAIEPIAEQDNSKRTAPVDEDTDLRGLPVTDSMLGETPTPSSTPTEADHWGARL